MSSDLAAPRYHESRRQGSPMDVGMFWEVDPEELARLLHDSEADRALRLTRIEEIWADRTAWIDRYKEVDAIRHALNRERDALLQECEGLRHAVVQARDLRAREQQQHAGERAVSEDVQAALMAERDALAAERAIFLAERAEYQEHIAALEADRAAVGIHRDALAADRDAQAAAREAAEARLATTALGGTGRISLARLLRAARRLSGL